MSVRNSNNTVGFKSSTQCLLDKTMLKVAILFSVCVQSDGALNYTILIKTGDIHFGGTDNSILLGINGDMSTILPTIIYNKDKNDFERNRLDSFTLVNQPDVGNVCGVTLRKLDGRFSDDWYVDYVTVIVPGTTTNSTFEFHQFIINEATHISTLEAVNGSWGEWSGWSNCTVCGGQRKRQRRCDTPEPSCNGNECDGKTEEIAFCQVDECQTGPGNTTLTPPAASDLVVPIACGVTAVVLVAIISTVTIIYCLKRQWAKKSRKYQGRSSPDIQLPDGYVHGETKFVEPNAEELLTFYTVMPNGAYDSRTESNSGAKYSSRLMAESDYYNADAIDISVLSNSTGNTNHCETGESLKSELGTETPPCKTETAKCGENVYMDPNIDLARVVSVDKYGYAEVSPASKSTSMSTISPQKNVPHYFDMSGSRETNGTVSPSESIKDKSCLSTWLENDAYYA